MCKIIRFPIERVKKAPTITINKLEMEEISKNLQILEKNGIRKYAGTKILKAMYMTKFFKSCPNNKLTQKAFDLYWNFFVLRKIA